MNQTLVFARDPAPALAGIEPLQQERARQEARDQRRQEPVGPSRHHQPAAFHQPAIAGGGHLAGRYRKRPRRLRLGNPSTRLELGRHRPRAQAGYPDAKRLELDMQRLAEREHESLAGVVHRRPRPRQKSRHRCDVKQAAAVPAKAVDEREREIGERAHVEVDHRQLLGAVEYRRHGRPARSRRC